MDLLKTLNTKIESLEDGEYTPGLQATVLHVDTAFRHLSRGQEQDDDTAFTDAIYRTNQAFEGSIKEAYRVFAGKDPAKKRPYDIEKYLETNNVFRSRVLSQFTNYRTEWRNPSTHDYKLDFDESEAFLAIVSVSAFACLLIDQIAERLSFEKAKSQTDADKKEIKKHLKNDTTELIEAVVQLLEEFQRRQHVIDQENRLTEIQVIGALAGFMASAAPSIEVQIEHSLVANSKERADVVFTRGDEKVLLELKSSRWVKRYYRQGLFQLEHYLIVSGLRKGILLLYSDSSTELERTDYLLETLEAKIVILQPKAKA